MTPWRAVLAVPLALAAAATGFSVLQPGAREATASLVVEVVDVARGRVPMIDTSSTNGWLSLDVLGALFAVLAPSEGRMVLVVSALAAACAALLVVLALLAGRSPAAGVTAAVAAVVAATLGAPLPDAYAPSSGALVLVVPLAAAACAAGGVSSGRWRVATLALLAVGAVWSPATALLTVLAVAAGVVGWPDRRRWVRRGALVIAGSLLTYLLAVLARAGTLPSIATLWDALLPTGRLDEPPPVPGAGTGWLLLAILAVLVVRRRRADVDRRAAAALRAATVLCVAVGLWACLASSTVGLGYAVASGALVVLGGAGPGIRGRLVAAGAVVLVVVFVGATAEDRWTRTALYDALPHQALAQIGFGEHAGGALRYDLDLLWRLRRAEGDDVLGDSVTREGSAVLVAVDAVALARAMGDADVVSLLPVGDPTRPRLPRNLRGRVGEAVARLPDGARLLARADWWDLARRGEVPADQTAVFEALERVVTSRRVVEAARGPGVVLLTLRPRIG